MSSRIRGIRQPIPAGTILGRTGIGNGPPLPIKIGALLQGAGASGAAFVRANQSDTSLDGIEVNTVGDTVADKDLIQYVAANSDFEYKSLSEVLDAAAGSTQGSIIYRNASGWVILTPAPSTAYYLRSGGSGANPSWQIVRTPPQAVSALPTAVEGLHAFVNDATLTMTLGIGTIAAGGGSNHVPVYCDGTNWLIG